MSSIDITRLRIPTPGSNTRGTRHWGSARSPASASVTRGWWLMRPGEGADEKHRQTEARPRIDRPGGLCIDQKKALGNREPSWRSGQDVVYDIPGDVGQPEVAAAIAIGQFSVVHAQSVQNGGVQVVNVYRILH